MEENKLKRLNRLERKLRRRRVLRLLPSPRKTFKDKQNPFEMYDSEQFKARYHMFKETVLYVTEIVRKDLDCPLKRSCCLPAEFQLLICLRFFATGSFQIVVGDLHIVSQPSVSKITKRVSEAIGKHCERFIKFPTFAEAPMVKEQFYLIAQFPGVTGAIDGCQIEINSPGGSDAEFFRNRKGDFALNVQGVCDASLNFTNLVARWYGSADDSRIFENSFIYVELEDGNIPGLLLGDSGYPCLPFLMTPLDKPETAAEKRYNKSQKTTRNTIERCFGIWKRRFPCLKYLRLKLQTCMTVIVATAVLHNISRARNDIFEKDKFDCGTGDDTSFIGTSTSLTGLAKRQQLIATHFTVT